MFQDVKQVLMKIAEVLQPYTTDPLFNDQFYKFLGLAVRETCTLESGDLLSENVITGLCVGSYYAQLLHPLNNDIDGDGVYLTASDFDTDGDGITNEEDNDIDNDGIPNEEDNDIDNDGIPNFGIDGIEGNNDDDPYPNGVDSSCQSNCNDDDDDIDGDGITNEEEE